jgi:hypothetical protein
MTEKEMRAASAAKVKQVMDLMKLLHLEVEARQKINQQGFIEQVIFWVDNEKYPTDEPEVAHELKKEDELPTQTT